MTFARPLRVCRWTFSLLLIVLPGLVAAGVASAQHPAAVDSTARAFKAETNVPGLVVGTLVDGQSHVSTYGVADRADSTSLTADTRFEIGSVTKAFTGLLLAERASRDAVPLDAPIGQFLPDSVRSPTADGPPIRLRHLATHTSGLPRLPANLSLRQNRTDPYADYTPAKLHAFLNDVTLSTPPGSTYAYSNVGAGLLGHLLARHADTTYAALLKDRVLAPLGLHDTSVPASSDTDDPRLATGYTRMGPAPYWSFDALAGAGALRSTPVDLLRFLRAHLSPEQAPLSTPLRHTHQVRHRAERRALTLSWHVSEGPDGSRLYWHNGGTGGFRSFVGFDRQANRAVVVLANQALSLRRFNQFAFRVVRALAQKGTGS
jgi:CubicO group peptidase (beta-lactamase class C family)